MTAALAIPAGGLVLPPSGLILPRRLRRALGKVAGFDFRNILRPVRMDGQFQPYQPLQFEDGQLGQVSGYGLTVETFDLSYLTRGQGTTDGPTTHSFTSQSLGAVSPTRVMILCVTASGSGTQTINSITIDGVTATQRVSGGGSGRICRIYTADLSGSSNTTGTVAIDVASGVQRVGWGMFRMVGGNEVPTDTGGTAVSADPIGMNLDIPAGGGAVGHCFNFNTNTVTWTGLTERWDATFESSLHSGASAMFASAQTNLTITANFSGTHSNAVSSSAAWGP